jgi:hypothetical protein
MPMSGSEINGITIDFRKVNARSIDMAYVKTAVEIVQGYLPNLRDYLHTISFVPITPIRTKRVMTEQERFVLNFINVSGAYKYHYGPVAPGRIVMQYLPFVDFVTCVTLHELAHVLDRAADWDAVNRARAQGKRHDVHSVRWSQLACGLYREFGCEKAALITDGMNYKSIRQRHALLLPSERNWAYRIWSMYDTGQIEGLHDEFAELFTS